MNQKLIDNLEFVHSRRKWLSKDRKIVLPHHKTFDRVDDLMDKVSESIDTVSYTHLTLPTKA